MPDLPRGSDAIRLFADALRLTGVAHTGPEPRGDPRLLGKRLGLINGSAWVTLWSYYFGRLYLPGVHLVNVGNEAVQINFMEAHQQGRPTPPRANVEAFTRYALDLIELARVDAILITCSTMNRALPDIREALADAAVPVVAIDQPMMRRAVEAGGEVLVVATHGPTVRSTQALLQETAEEMGVRIAYDGCTSEEAWHRLAVGDVAGHNRILAELLRARLATRSYSAVVFAQLSMSVFLLSHPEPLAEFGVPVLTSGQCGFEHMADVLAGAPRS